MSVQELWQRHEELRTRGVQLAVEYQENPSAEGRTAILTLAEDMNKVAAELGQERDTAAAIEAIRGAQQPPLNGMLPVGGKGEEGDAGGFTPSDRFLASDAYAAWMKRYPGGGPSTEGTRDTSDAHEIEGPMARQMLEISTPSERLRGRLTPAKFRSLISSDAAVAGSLVWPQFLGLLEPGLVRPLRIRQLVTTMPVSSNTIEYVAEVSRVAGALPVAEATALTGTSGTKPEGGIVFTIVQDVIRTMAEWVPITKNIMSDAPQLRAYIDQYLIDDLGRELEDQMVTGPGGGQNFTGILNTAGIQATGAAGANENNLDLIRRAIRLVRINARTEPTAVVLNPIDVEKLDIAKFGTGGTIYGYVGGGPYGALQTSPWGLPRVESEAVTPGTALVGDFRRAILFDRETLNISVGTVNDDFIRNILRILAEMRAGFGVLRPKAFCTAPIT